MTHKIKSTIKKVLSWWEKKSLEEERHDQYIDAVVNTTEHYNGVRMNDKLVGKMHGIRLTELECPTETAKELAIEKTVPRPKMFKIIEGKEVEYSFGNDIIAWSNALKEEAKAVIAKNQQYANEEKEYIEKVKSERNAKALEERRKFFQEYGLLPKSEANGAVA